MKFLGKIEAGLAKFFDKLPDLSLGTKELLVKFMPWLALIGGLFQLFAAWSLYVWARGTNELVEYAERLRKLGIETEVAKWDFWIITAFILLVIDAVILLVAFPKLQSGHKSGWNLMLISAFISLLYSVGSLILRYRGSLWEDIWSLCIALLVFYILFQVRKLYNK